MRAAERFHLDPGDWFRPSAEHPAPPAVAHLVWSERCARIDYRRGNGEAVVRTVAPLGIVLKSGLWYLVASVEGAPRVYRVSRIQTIEERDAPCERDPDFDLGTFWRDWAEAFEKSLAEYPVTLRLSPWAGEHVERLLGEPVRRVPPGTKPIVEHDGWQRRLIVFEKFEHAKRAALGLGDQAEVLEPTELRSAVADEAKVIAERHGPRRLSG